MILELAREGGSSGPVRIIDHEQFLNAFAEELNRIEHRGGEEHQTCLDFTAQRVIWEVAEKGRGAQFDKPSQPTQRKAT